MERLPEGTLDPLLTRVESDTFAGALASGSSCTADFASADHLAMAEWPLEKVRERFGVRSLAP